MGVVVSTVTERQKEFALKVLFVQFEQGRGKGGVPKITLHVHEQDTLDSLILKALALMRIECEMSHNRDLMPEGEYFFHRLEGGMLKELEELQWHKNKKEDEIASVILTWGESPSEHLMAQIKSNSEDEHEGQAQG